MSSVLRGPPLIVADENCILLPQQWTLVLSVLAFRTMLAHPCNQLLALYVLLVHFYTLTLSVCKETLWTQCLCEWPVMLSPSCCPKLNLLQFGLLVWPPSGLRPVSECSAPPFPPARPSAGRSPQTANSHTRAHTHKYITLRFNIVMSCTVHVFHL